MDKYSLSFLKSKFGSNKRPDNKIPAQKAMPRSNFSVDTGDVTEKMYQDWLRTGKIPTEGGDALRLHNNIILQEFVKRRKREKK